MLAEKILPDNGDIYLNDRWEPLKNRLADELARGYTLSRVSAETGLRLDTLEKWAADSDAFRDMSRVRVGDLCLAQKIEDKLTQWFSDLDAERAGGGEVAEEFVPTNVARNVISGIQRARALQVMVEIAAPSGSGKTWAMEHYIAQCRKEEGFACPIWAITLSECGFSLKTILHEIDLQIRDGAHYGADGGRDMEYHAQHRIEEKASGRKGVLIIDEAQQLGDTSKINAVGIINGLRWFVDKRLFGIALLSNGEVYRRVKSSRHAQLASRMEAWCINAKEPTADDVEAIMSGWGVSGKKERDYSVKVGTGQGGLRALTNIYRAALHDFGEISYRTMTIIRRI